MATMKLVRITPYLYRTEDGAFRVAKQVAWRGVKAHWSVRFVNWYGAEVVRRFATLADVKQWLKTKDESLALRD